jgi:hypothetical protein
VIVYLVTAKHSYTMRRYLRTWGRPLASRIQIFFYDLLTRRHRRRGGTYIFSDIERLSSERTELAAEVWERLSHEGEDVQLLNHPSSVLRRSELLEVLHRRGFNEFQAYRVSDGRKPTRFPVFLRHAKKHSASMTPLLRTETELERAISETLSRGYGPRDLLVVEFCDTSDSAGIFRKYSAFGIRGEIVPRHLIFSDRWVVKLPHLLDEQKLREERDYLERNPHAEFLREIFRVARIDYGRVDYALLDGRPQVWEINTNPMVMLRPSQYQRQHLPAQELFAREIGSAFESLNASFTRPHAEAGTQW